MVNSGEGKEGKEGKQWERCFVGEVLRKSLIEGKYVVYGGNRAE